MLFKKNLFSVKLLDAITLKWPKLYLADFTPIPANI